MTAFRHLTEAEARTLTRAELLDRIEAEQAHWARKQTLTPADREAERELGRILHAFLSPHDAIQAAMDAIHGCKSDYWESRPDGPEGEQQ